MHHYYASLLLLYYCTILHAVCCKENSTTNSINCCSSVAYLIVAFILVGYRAPVLALANHSERLEHRATCTIDTCTTARHSSSSSRTNIDSSSHQFVALSDKKPRSRVPLLVTTFAHFSTAVRQSARTLSGKSAAPQYPVRFFCLMPILLPKLFE